MFTPSYMCFKNLFWSKTFWEGQAKSLVYSVLHLSHETLLNLNLEKLTGDKYGLLHPIFSSKKSPQPRPGEGLMINLVYSVLLVFPGTRQYLLSYDLYRRGSQPICQTYALLYVYIEQGVMSMGGEQGAWVGGNLVAICNCTLHKGNTVETSNFYSAQAIFHIQAHLHSLHSST